jgi:hypothetical protein
MNEDAPNEKIKCCMSELYIKCKDKNAYHLSQQFLLSAQCVNSDCMTANIHVNIYEDWNW